MKNNESCLQIYLLYGILTRIFGLKAYFFVVE